MSQLCPLDIVDQLLGSAMYTDMDDTEQNYVDDELHV